jgi:signal recognition particle GTPase
MSLMLYHLNSRTADAVTVMEIALKPRPSLVQNFIGREDILQSIRKNHVTDRLPHLHKPAVSVLSGLGGSGKTQTALKFALEFEEL